MTPEISIIIEWENYILSDMERSFKMLEKLNSQIPQVQKPIEVIVLFNPEQIEKTFLDRIFGSILDSYNNYSFIRIEEARGKNYYDLKNEGVKLAQGEIIIFLDSDVIPEEKWLINIVQPFYDNSDIDVVAGNSYIDCYSLYSKAFALGWFFGLRLGDSMLIKKHSGFYANNVAFRKEVLMSFPFPVMPEGVTRGACSMLNEELEKVGIDVWSNTAAQVSHPPPNGIFHFYTRALAEGRDHLLTDKLNLYSFIRYYYWKRIRDSLHRILNNRKKVNLSIWEAPIAIGIMCSYYSIYLIGGVLTILIPEYAKSSWRI